MHKLISSGDVYWLDDCPPLDGGQPRRAPVIIIDAEDPVEVFVLGVTTDRTDPDRIDLPNRRDEPEASSGLSEPCCTIPRWIICVQRSRFTTENYLGWLPRVTLDQIEQALERLTDLDAGSPPPTSI